MSLQMDIQKSDIKFSRENSQSCQALRCQFFREYNELMLLVCVF